MAGSHFHLFLWTFTVMVVFISALGFYDYYDQPMQLSQPQLAMQDCLGLLKQKLFFRFRPDQIRIGCVAFTTWGNMSSLPPSKNITSPMRLYWDGLTSRGRERPMRPLLRKEYRMLTNRERQRFHDAVVNLKRTPLGDTNRYDAIIAHHQPAVAPGAHFGVSFLGWHREFVFRLERALQDIDPGVAVPYWDSTMDQILGAQARNTVMWTPDFMGNIDGDVVTGPFRNWPLMFPVQNRTRLFRMMVPEGGLYSDGDVETILNSDFRSLTWFVDPFMEVVHGTVHDWIGGVLGDLGSSPADPVFLLLHSWVEFLFQAHRDIQGQFGIDVRFNYPNDSVALGVGRATPEGEVLDSPYESLQLATRAMVPFNGLRNIDGLSMEYSHFYTYAPRPTCSRLQPSCGSPYLFCATNREKCAPKLQEGAICQPWANMGPCYQSVCCNGICSPTCAK